MAPQSLVTVSRINMQQPKSGTTVYSNLCDFQKLAVAKLQLTDHSICDSTVLSNVPATYHNYGIINLIVTIYLSLT